MKRGTVQLGARKRQEEEYRKESREKREHKTEKEELHRGCEPSESRWRKKYENLLTVARFYWGTLEKDISKYFKLSWTQLSEEA